MSTDKHFARRSGQEIATRIRKSGEVSWELRLDLHGMLAFFLGEACEGYIQEIKPALEAAEHGVEMLPLERLITAQDIDDHPAGIARAAGSAGVTLMPAGCLYAKKVDDRQQDCPAPDFAVETAARRSRVESDGIS